MPHKSAALRRVVIQTPDGGFPVAGCAPAQTPKFASIVAASSGDIAIVAAVTGKKIRVLEYVLTADGAVNAKWRSAANDRSGLLYLGAKGSVSTPFVAGGLLETASGEALQLNLSGAVAVGGHLIYVEV